MSLDITFEKQFTINDVEKHTTLKAEFIDNNWWLCKNDNMILINCYTYTEEDIEDLKNSGENIINEDGNLFIVYDDDKELIIMDKQKDNIVFGISRYGMNDISEILNELVLTFQTKFLTDEEEEMSWRDPYLNIDNLYNISMSKFDFKFDANKVYKCI